MTGAVADTLEAAALAASLGIDPTHIMTASHPVEERMWATIIERAFRTRRRLDEALAGDMMGRVFGGRK